MNKLFQLVITTSLVALIMGSCAPAPTPTPTPLPPTDISLPPSDTPVPTDTPLPPTNTAVPPTETLPPPTPMPVLFELTSAAFEPGQPIPVRHACHGENLSPPLAWSQPPPGTESYVLVMDDPDAVGVVGFVWDHWLLFNVPANVLSLSEGLPRDAELSDGSRQGQNSSKRLGYDGPCPPSGQTHSYVVTLYAVDTILALEPGAGKGDILQAIDGHILAQAQLVGLYTSP